MYREKCILCYGVQEKIIPYIYVSALRNSILNIWYTQRGTLTSSRSRDWALIQYFPQTTPRYRSIPEIHSLTEGDHIILSRLLLESV